MIRRTALVLALSAALLPQAYSDEPAPLLLGEANVLPLALDDAFEFRKVVVDTFTQESRMDSWQIPSRMLRHQRESKLHGALGRIEERERYGNHFTFHWRASEPTDLTVRLEYRQQNLGAHVQAREFAYTNASGTNTTRFRIIGDDFERDGNVTSWRALLIKDGRIVALHASALWN